MFTLDQVVPWGRSFDEYRRMFALSPDDLRGRILGCADGPASFNAEATAVGLTVVSCDPLYRFTVADIRRRIAETTEVIIEQTQRNQQEFVWTSIRSVEELRQLRSSAMERFLADFEEAKRRTATLMLNCRRCRLATEHLIWRSARTSCSSTPSNCLKTFTSRRCGR